MSFRRENEIDLDQLAAFLQDAVDKVKTQENPDLLNDIKKVFKKNVPFSLRMYVAAYLTKQCGSHFRPRREFTNDRNNRRDFRKDNQKNEYRQDRNRDNTNDSSENTEARQPHPRVQIDESLATTIFVGIGRNRRVYPRDLVGLLISVAGLDRDRIGDIRVLANYSFVQLFTEDADKAINALNGYDYRGRKLSVSYSRQKGEEGAEGTDSSDETIPANVDSGYTDPQSEVAKDDAAALAAAERNATTEAVSTDSNYLV
ncbi:MAG: DbpA RNA binding domain-containing protein [Treponema sp.]|nr:DbpA RNA binding domain-containing protein [Candidatus Treponema merdequi]